MATLGIVLATLAVAGFAAGLAFMAGTLYFLVLHAKCRRDGLADEARVLALPLPAEPDLPHVVVQIPTYNEGPLALRCVAAAAQLDWPRDKLHIQVLDDSTDGSTEYARHAAAEAEKAGVDATVLHRVRRDEFKAGALRNGMAQTPHGYFAIFDVDYVPPPDFLRRCMAPLLGEPQLGFVQARMDFLNAGENALTRAQAAMLDAHCGIEQATRSWAGHPLPFNGTCGIWRREAIEAAGGWRGATLAEDLDLSYRAWFAGWRGRYLVSVAAPGELPPTIRAWARQQKRWNIGFGQVSRRMLPFAMARRGLPLASRFAAILHLGMWWSALVVSITTLATIAAIVVEPGYALGLGAMTVGLIAAGYGVYACFLLAGRRFLRGKTSADRGFARIFATIVGMLLVCGFVGGPTAWDAFAGRRSFVRTPKRGASTTPAAGKAEHGGQ